MALVNNGTVNGLHRSQLPATYVLPTVTLIPDYHYPRTMTLNVLKSTVHNADPLITMANIISDAGIGITKQVSDIMALDFLGTATVTFYTEWIGLKTNFSKIDAEGDFLTDAVASYECKVVIYIKAV